MKVKGEIKSHKQQEKDDIVQDADFAADFTGPKLTSDGTLCTCGDHSFVPISWLCKKQTAVSHSRTEAEMVSWNNGPKTEGLLAL